MAKNRFSDLNKNNSDEGWKEETTKEKNPQEPASDQKRCEREKEAFLFFFLVLYVNLIDRELIF